MSCSIALHLLSVSLITIAICLNTYDIPLSVAGMYSFRADQLVLDNQSGGLSLGNDSSSLGGH